MFLLYSLGDMPVCDFTNFPKKDMFGKFIESDISFIVMFEYFRRFIIAFIVN